MVEAITSEVEKVSAAIDVLGAMITPAILILASGSIVATTSARLIRVIDRVRELSREITALTGGDQNPVRQERRELLFLLLRSATRRARLLQRAMTRTYLAIAAFILTSIVIGVLSLTTFDTGWIALLIGFIGAVLLLETSVILIYESRIALSSTKAETKFIWKEGRRELSEGRIIQRLFD